MSSPTAVPHPGAAVAAMEGGVAVMVQCPHPNGSWLPLGPEHPPLSLLRLPL